MILMHERVAYYYYAGATKEGNNANLPYLVAWEAMKAAKERGCKVWDWEGIYDSRWPNKGWRGFSHFKRSFGGVEVEYPGCFSLWRWPIS
jgi:lipid II:glycine glycyltransferase (peptidoglycan interpeptide bridge formation enzyme)